MKVTNLQHSISPSRANSSTSLFKYLITGMVLVLLLTSCRKDKDEKDTDTATAADNALAEGTYNDVNNIADQAATGLLPSYIGVLETENRSPLSTCATITNDTVSTPHILTIDFGTTNCLCNDGRNRRGKINVAYTGLYRDSASTHTITFTDYYVNDNQVLGSKTVTNNGHNAAGNLSYSVSVNGQIIKAGGGGTINWTSARTREWILGEGTLVWNDDVYLITGTASGTSAAGVSFTMAITSPLRKEISCRHIVSGSLTLTPSGKPVRYVNFGSGSCDNQATVTINGNVYNITLF